MSYDDAQTRHRPVAAVCAGVTRRGSEHPRGGIMTVCHWCQQPDPDVECLGNPIITSASRPSKTVSMSDYTFRGCHAPEKPRAPTGEFISQDGTTACRDGVTRAMCVCVAGSRKWSRTRRS